MGHIEGVGSIRLEERLTQLLGHQFQCACGKTHAISLKTVYVGPDAFAATAEYVASNRAAWSGDGAYIMADTTTYDVAGRDLEQRLQGVAVPVRSVVLEVPLVPDEAAVERLRQAVNQSGIVLAVGAGTIHDLARYIATEKGLPFISVPTAPSVDGFASSVSPLIVKGQKKTFPATMPIAVFADQKVLAESPAELIAAGYGDIVGKTTSLADWALSNVINDEWICPWIVQIVSDLTKEVVTHRFDMNARRKGAEAQQRAVATLMRALVLSGLAIDMAQSSRPASGSEHHMSHYWEMRGLWTGVNVPYHGAKVAVATVTSSRLYAWIDRHKDFLNISLSDAPQMWQRVSRRVDAFFGPLADQIKAEIRPRYDALVVENRLKRILDRWAKIRPVLGSLMFDSQTLIRLLQDALAPAHYEALGLPGDWALGALLVGKEIRERYTILQFADDLALLDRVADDVLNFPPTASSV